MIINPKKKKIQKKENEHTVLIFIKKKIKNKTSSSLREEGLFDQHSSFTVDIKKKKNSKYINK